MQRKNRILKRRGMAMIMAIFMILIIGGIMAIVISMTADTSKRTTNIYLHEQAIELTRSATEYALLAVSGHDHAALNNCINQIDMIYPDTTNPMFDISITLNYIGFGGPAGNDAIGGANEAACSDYIDIIQTPESNGSILMDVTVRSDPGLNLDEPIVYHRRTLQKM